MYVPGSPPTTGVRGAAIVAMPSGDMSIRGETMTASDTVKQQRRHHDGIKRRLAPLAAVGARDLGEVDCLPHQAQHKAGEMVRRNEVLHRRGQKQWLIDLPRPECLAHAPRQNLIRPSQASEIHLILGQAPRSGGSDRLRIVRNLPIATENNRAAVRTWFGPPSVRRRLRRKLLGLRTM